MWDIGITTSLVLHGCCDIILLVLCLLELGGKAGWWPHLEGTQTEQSWKKKERRNYSWLICCIFSLLQRRKLSALTCWLKYSVPLSAGNGADSFPQLPDLHFLVFPAQTGLLLMIFLSSALFALVLDCSSPLSHVWASPCTLPPLLVPLLLPCRALWHSHHSSVPSSQGFWLPINLSFQLSPLSQHCMNMAMLQERRVPAPRAAFLLPFPSLGSRPACLCTSWVSSHLTAAVYRRNCSFLLF